jgi:hypothetical protein
MDLVRSQIASLPVQYTKLLADPNQRRKLADPPAPKDEAAWINHQTASLLEELKDPTLDAPGLEELNKILAATPDAAANELPSRVEMYLARVASNGCNKCHELQGDVSAVWTGKRLAAKSSTEADQVQLLKTQPTGMTNQPRRWFIHSRFDHDAHRNVGCIDCHTQTIESKLTSDVSMPNMESCVSCHRADSSKIKGITVDCVSCHQFHDRTRERQPTTRPSGE